MVIFSLVLKLHSEILIIKGPVEAGFSGNYWRDQPWVNRELQKVLADNVGITCRLVKGSHYTGVEDDALNIIKLTNESEFLVDLMGAPGTLIPVDIFSTDNSLKLYNPKLSKLPSLQTMKKSGGVYSRPTLTGQYEGSRQNANENSLHCGRKSGSDKKESIRSVSRANSDSGPGSSGFTKKGTSNNQLDNIPSLAIGTSLYKGGRGLNAVGDGLRMNVNVVPYTHNGAEDTKSLFADLNPFQIKGSGKASMLNNPTENKVDDFQWPRKNVVSGWPLIRSKWKNNYAYNEGPGRKEYEFVESLFPKYNHEANGYKKSSSSTSSAVPENVYNDNSNLNDDLCSAPCEYGDRDSSTGSNSLNLLIERQSSGMTLEEDTRSYEQYHGAGEV